MGTNYYVNDNYCDHCKRGDDIHIGKSSYGWAFAFQFNEGKYYKNIYEMKKWLIGKEIKDEYSRKISKRTFWQMVDSKQKHEHHWEGVINIGGYDFLDYEFS